MLARVKLKGIDGSPHKRWIMRFNSMQHEEPYQGLTCHEGERNLSVLPPRGLNVNTGGAWLSSARVVRCCVKSRNERNPRALFICQSRLLVINQRKVRMTSSQHAPYTLGYTRATMARTKRCYLARVRQPQKPGLSSDCRLQLACMKSESLVIAGQLYSGESVPGRCVQGPGQDGPLFSWQAIS